MYNKLFAKILDSSIWLAPDPFRLVWITLLAAMDEDGNAMFACVDNLALRARVPLHEAESAVKAFESPDHKSGDPDNEGRRIERIPGGWHVLNAHKYRAIVTRAVARENTRKRVAAYRERHRSNADVTLTNDSVTPSEADSYSDAEASLRAKTNSSEGNPDASYEVTEACKIGYPAGTYRANTWGYAQREIRTLLMDGVPRETLIAAALAYREQQDAAGNTGSKFILSPLNFFKDGNWKGPFPLPKTKGESARDSNIDASLKWLETSNAAK